MEIISLILLGVIISVLSGFFGVGGGFILTPILLLIGFPVLEAITISLLYTIGTSSSGILAHLRLKNIIWKAGILLGVSGVIATQVAKPFVLYMDSRGVSEIIIPSIYILFLSFFAFRMLMEGRGKKIEPSEGAPTINISKLLVFGFLGGFISTTLGVGGGFIIVPLLISFLRFTPKEAVGTSLFAVLMIVLAGFSSYIMNVTIDVFTGVYLVIGGLVGSQFGARLTSIYKSKEINLLLGGLYIATLLSVILKLFSLNIVGLGILAAFIAFFFIKSIHRLNQRTKFLTEK